VLQYKDAFLGAKNTTVFLSGNIEPQKVKKYAEQWIASIPTSSTYPIDASYEQYALPNKTYTKTIERKDTDDIATVMYGAFRRLDDDAIVRIKSNLIKSDLIDGIASDYITEKIQMRVREELGQAFTSGSLNLLCIFDVAIAFCSESEVSLMGNNPCNTVAISSLKDSAYVGFVGNDIRNNCSGAMRF
jgi:predicted Zn-dependent peptidase